jgi:hypothetical protein
MRVCWAAWRRGRGRFRSSEISRRPGHCQRQASYPMPAPKPHAHRSTARQENTHRRARCRSACCPAQSRIEELEDAMLGGFDRSDVARQPGKRRAQILARLAKRPPQVAVTGAVVVVTLRLHPFQHPLIGRRPAAAHFVGLEAEEVDQLHAARPVGEVAAIAVGLDRRVGFEPRRFSGLTMKPAPCSLKPGELMPPFAAKPAPPSRQRRLSDRRVSCRCTRPVPLPILRPCLRARRSRCTACPRPHPARRRSSRCARRRRRRCPPRDGRVAKARWIGRTSTGSVRTESGAVRAEPVEARSAGCSAACTTRRLKVWRSELVVMKPKRASLPCATSCAAWCHQNMTKSADSGTAGQRRAGLRRSRRRARRAWSRRR